MSQPETSSQATALLGLLAETSLHAGAGQSVGAIDLPIQREGHSDWPCVYGSAVKGAMRARAEDLGYDTLDEIFGPDTRNASDHAGALVVGDARLLLLPVRSLTGHYRWVTCPALLRRLANDARRLGVDLGDLPVPTVTKDTTALVGQGDRQALFLEEYRLDAEPHDLGAVTAAVARLLDPDSAALLPAQLTVVADGLFGDLARYATPVAAHVRIDNETKTVLRGALWYEESLPPDTLLYVGLAAWKARKREARLNQAAMVLDGVLSGLFRDRPYLQLGGNETVGMGWCRVTSLRGE